MANATPVSTVPANAAPVFNKIAIAPPTPDPGQLPATVDPKRVVAAIRFGDALEELVARCRLQEDVPDALQKWGSRFPLDLVHRRSPKALLKGVLDKLLKLEREVLAAQGPENIPEADGQAAPATPSPSEDEPALRTTSSLDDQAAPGATSPAGDRAATSVEMPSAKIQIESKIEELSRVYEELSKEYEERDGDAGMPDPARMLNPVLFSGNGGIHGAIRDWDTYVVDSIVDEDPALLAGYKVGKALSLTRWQIWAAKHPAPGDEPSPAPWKETFDERRIGEIQRHLDILSNVLGDRLATTVVVTSLGYWRNTLLNLDHILDPSEPDRRRAVAVPSEYDGALEAALAEQRDNWLDLLTGRRSTASFPVAGIVTALTKDLTESLGAGFWARLIRYATRVFAVVAVLLILAALVMVGVVAYLYFKPSPGGAAGVSPTGGLLGSLGTTVAGVFAILVARGRALFNRGADVVDRLRERVDALQKQVDGASDRAMAALGLQPVSWQGLGNDVFSNVVSQVRLEEYNLAVSAPLVRFVLDLNDDKPGEDPLEDAKRFLRLTYGSRSNLDRLEPIFKELYKSFRAAPSE